MLHINLLFTIKHVSIFGQKLIVEMCVCVFFPLRFMETRKIPFAHRSWNPFPDCLSLVALPTRGWYVIKLCLLFKFSPSHMIRSTQGQRKALTKLRIEPTFSGTDHCCSTDLDTRPDGNRSWVWKIACHGKFLPKSKVFNGIVSHATWLTL